MVRRQRADPNGGESSVSHRDTESLMTDSPSATLPPLLPGGLPYLGHAVEFWSRPVDLLQAGQRRFGSVWSFVLAGQRATVLTGPEGNEAFFRAPDDVLSARE